MHALPHGNLSLTTIAKRVMLILFVEDLKLSALLKKEFSAASR